MRRQFAAREGHPYPDYALRFNSGDHVNLGDVLSGFTADTPFLIELWVKTAYSGAQAFLCSQESSPTGKGIQLGMSTRSTLLLRIQGDKRLSVLSGVRTEDDWITIDTGEWLHVAGRYTGNREVSGLSLLIDGEEVERSPESTGDNDPGDISTTSPTYLGVRRGSEIPFTGSMDDVRVWVGTLPTQQHIAHYMNERLATPYCPLFNNTHKKFNASASQGIATDGTYIYATNNTTLFKYNMSGGVVGTVQHGLNGWKYEDFPVVDGIAYVPITNHGSVPRAGKIQLINVSTMTVIDTIDLEEPVWPASMAYKDGLFWMSVTESDTVYVYDSSFTLQDTYTFNVLGEQSTVWPGYSGLEWIGDYLYGNKHEGITDRQLDVARFDPIRNELVPVGAFLHVSSGTSQGMTYDAINDKVYWAARGHSNEVWESDLTGGLVGYWTMNEGQGSTLADSTGNHSPGTIHGATWTIRQ